VCMGGGQRRKGETRHVAIQNSTTQALLPPCSAAQPHQVCVGLPLVTVGHEVKVPAGNTGEAGIATSAEATQQVERRRRLVVGSHKAGGVRYTGLCVRGQNMHVWCVFVFAVCERHRLMWLYCYLCIGGMLQLQLLLLLLLHDCPSCLRSPSPGVNSGPLMMSPR
jgi:hypothetical protein